MTAGEPTNPWLAEDVALLTRLVEANESNAVIAERLGRSVRAVKAKISRMTLPKRICRPRSLWPAEEAKELLRLRDEMRLGWSEIATRLNRPSSSCHTKYYALKNPTVTYKVIQREVISTEAHEDWVRRMMLSPSSLTAAMFGDPLPGYSALDKRAP